jgi:hypothetical protein
MDGMASTLQINLTEVRDIAWQVAGVAGLIADQGFRLRLAPASPATDTTSLALTRNLQGASLRLAYAADSAADELTRAIEGVVAYAQQGANLARRTELALIGLDLEQLTPSFPISAPRPDRRVVVVDDAPSPPGPVVDSTDHRILCEAVLLSNGAASLAHMPADAAQLRAGAATLHDCARRLRAALSSGERPAAMLDRFGAWLDEGFVHAVEEREQAMARWAVAYGTARSEVQEPARVYLSWLSAAVAGADQGDSGLREPSARARTAMRGYSAVSFDSVACRDHPRLGQGTT